MVRVKSIKHVTCLGTLKFQITRKRFSPIEHLWRLRVTKTRNWLSIWWEMKCFNRTKFLEYMGISTIQTESGCSIFSPHCRGFFGLDFLKKTSVTLLVCYPLIYRMTDSGQWLILRWNYVISYETNLFFRDYHIRSRMYSY